MLEVLGIIKSKSDKRTFKGRTNGRRKKISLREINRWRAHKCALRIRQNSGKNLGRKYVEMYHDQKVEKRYHGEDREQLHEDLGLG